MINKLPSLFLAPNLAVKIYLYGYPCPLRVPDIHISLSLTASPLLVTPASPLPHPDAYRAAGNHGVQEETARRQHGAHKRGDALRRSGILAS